MCEVFDRLHRCKKKKKTSGAERETKRVRLEKREEERGSAAREQETEGKEPNRESGRKSRERR